MRSGGGERVGRAARRFTSVVLAIGVVASLGGATASASAAVSDCSSSTLQVDPSLPNANLAQAYSHQIYVYRGTPPYTFSLVQGSSLPPGLSMSSSGLVTGTPLVPGQTRFAVQVVDSSAPAQCTNGGVTINVVTGTPLEGLIQILDRLVSSGCVQSTVSTLLNGTPPNPGCML
jgi:hypothetical protein